MPCGNKAEAVLLYQRGSQPDEGLAGYIEDELKRRGCAVVVDRHPTMGLDWAREVESRIRSADTVVPLISAESIQSEMLAFEVETAHEAAQFQQGRPRLLPIRVNYTGPLPEPLASILEPIPYFLWEGEQDHLGLVTELAEALKHPAGQTLEPAPAAARPPLRKPPMAPRSWVKTRALEAVGGAVPLDSEFYIARPTDGELMSAIARRDSVVLIKGARQMGKTSLLARGLASAREKGIQSVSTDLQKFNVEDFRDLQRLYRTMAESLAEQLEPRLDPDEHWDPRRGPNSNLERFVRRCALQGPVLWGLDEVDRLFTTPYATDVFGLIRSWHNERALDPSGPMANLTIAIAYATEAHLFIADINQSPFNVGTRLALQDFTPLQVAELNRRYQSPISSQDELNRFYRLVGGHPYLVRRGLQELTNPKVTFDAFEAQAAREEAFYGDHLRRILVVLGRDPKLAEVMRRVLSNEPGSDAASLDRLRSAGLVLGHFPEGARPRCRLYASYLRRHLA